MSAAGGGAAAAAAAAAAAKKRKEREEEEKLTKYNAGDLDGWEFKIMRSELGRFSSTEYLRRVREQEAKAGWEMVEKFDNSRVRFKRRVEKRSNDQFLEYDAYRTSAGFGGGRAGVIIGIILASLGVLAMIFFVSGRGGRDFEIAPGLIFPILVGVLLLVLGIVVAVRKR